LDVQEKACWLALFGASEVDRAAAKRVVYRLAVAEHTPLSVCAGRSAEDLAQLLPELSAEQLEAWERALAHREPSEQMLSDLSSQGMDVLTRADIAYPENLAERLPEPWLPYVLYYRGNVDLMARPCVSVAGTATPNDDAAQLVRTLAEVLSPLPLVLAGGYSQGVDRLMLTESAARAGGTMVMLPFGFAHAAPILRAGDQAVSKGERLELSPYAPETPFSPALGTARTRLVTALADALVFVDPDGQAEDWPGYSDLTAHGGLALIHAPSQASRTAAQGSPAIIAFTNSIEALQRISQHLVLEEDEPGVEEIAVAADTDESPDQVYRFADAASAIARLEETGHVPEKLIRRLREAEKRGTLSTDNE